MSFKSALLIPASLLVFAAAPAAEAQPAVKAFGLLNHSSYTIEATSTTGRLGLGGGVGLAIPVRASWDLEFQALYLSRNNRNSARYVQLPLLARYHLGKTVSVGTGLYYARAVGQVSTPQGDRSLADAGFRSGDFGAVGLLGLSFPTAKYRLVMDFKYTFGLLNVSSIPGVVAKYDDFQVLFGLQFGAPSRRSRR